jgi:hypothetical protein
VDNAFVFSLQPIVFYLPAQGHALDSKYAQSTTMLGFLCLTLLQTIVFLPLQFKDATTYAGMVATRPHTTPGLFEVVPGAITPCRIMHTYIALYLLYGSDNSNVGSGLLKPPCTYVLIVRMST